MNERPFFLVLPYFTSSSIKRQAELEHCLRANSANQWFSKIVLLIDDETNPHVSHNVEVVRLQQRPTYADWIKVSTSFPVGTTSILANSDIVFDDSVRFIHKCLEGEKGFVALSRYESIDNKLRPHPDPHWSQDCWAIRSPELVSDTLFHSLNFPLGVPRCDNKVSYLFKVHGWRIVNPFKQVITRHVHGSEERTYDKIKDTRVLGAVAYVHPSEPPCSEAVVDFDIWCLNSSNVRSAKINRTFDKYQKINNSHGAEGGGLGKVGSKSIGCKESYANTPLDVDAITLVSSIDAKKKHATHMRVWKEVKRFGSRRLRPRLNELSHVLLRNTSALTKSIEAAREKAETTWPAVISGFPRFHARKQEKPSVISEAVAISLGTALRPERKGDVNYWQYPCLTELQAFKTHEFIPGSLCCDPALKVMHVYVGVPWATMIDARLCPSYLAEQLLEKIIRVQKLAIERGHKLRVHTVCQHYAWHKFLGHFEQFKITDLHLSHCVAGLSNPNINFHSWPLCAPNIENAFRSRGIRVALPLEERPLLASFIGAQMPHYRSNVRELLAEEARKDGGSDIYFGLSNGWHFNRVVYEEQLKGKMPSIEQSILELKQTEEYNKVLSSSVFSLCPEGAGPNTLRLWESLAVGAIPVVIGGGDWIPPELGGDYNALQRACLFVSRSDTAGLFERLRSVGPREIQCRKQAALECYQLARNKTAFGLCYPTSPL